jgi:hypothetical protein
MLGVCGSLRRLILSGTPAANTEHYRAIVASSLPLLVYLDDHPLHVNIECEYIRYFISAYRIEELDGLSNVLKGQKIYYLELHRSSEGTLSRWSRLHLQSLAPAAVSRRVDVRQAAGGKLIIAESLEQRDEKHIAPTPLSGIRVGRRRFPYIAF